MCTYVGILNNFLLKEYYRIFHTALTARHLYIATNIYPKKIQKKLHVEIYSYENLIVGPYRVYKTLARYTFVLFRRYIITRFILNRINDN